MALIIGHTSSQFKVKHNYIQDSSILTLSYPGSRVDQLWSKLEDIAIITIFLSPGCQQPFLIKMASDNRLSAAIFGPKWLVTTGCQQPLPIRNYMHFFALGMFLIANQTVRDLAQIWLPEDLAQVCLLGDPDNGLINSGLTLFLS